jgi:hypothetical protein
MLDIVKQAKGHSPSNDKVCYSTITLPKNMKPGIHRILFGWPFEKREHGSGQIYFDVIYLQITGGSASGDQDDNDKGVGNGIGLGSFTLQQMKTQAAYWHQSPFQSKVSHSQWLDSLIPKGKSQPEGPSCHYVCPVQSVYKLWSQVPASKCGGGTRKIVGTTSTKKTTSPLTKPQQPAKSTQYKPTNKDNAPPQTQTPAPAPTPAPTIPLPPQAPVQTPTQQHLQPQMPIQTHTIEAPTTSTTPISAPAPEFTSTQTNQQTDTETEHDHAGEDEQDLQQAKYEQDNKDDQQSHVHDDKWTDFESSVDRLGRLVDEFKKSYDEPENEWHHVENDYDRGHPLTGIEELQQLYPEVFSSQQQSNATRSDDDEGSSRIAAAPAAGLNMANQEILARQCAAWF